MLTLANTFSRSLLAAASSRFRLQLVVDGRQLLVGRLELLLGSFELFVGGLQLLVGRQDLLVGGRELFVGRLLLLDDRLEVLLRRRKLLLEMRDGSLAVPLPARLGCLAAVPEDLAVLENHEDVAPAIVERRDLQIDRAIAATVLAHAHARLSNPLVGSPRLLERVLQGKEQPLAGHLQDVERRRTGRGSQEIRVSPRNWTAIMRPSTTTLGARTGREDAVRAPLSSPATPVSGNERRGRDRRRRPELPGGMRR